MKTQPLERKSPPTEASGQSACEGVPEEKLVAIAVAVLLATAGVAWLVMVLWG